jgi:hypothetical protein
VETIGVRREQFVAETRTPPIDRGDGRSFHNPVIEVFELGGVANRDPSSREAIELADGAAEPLRGAM